MYNGSLAGLVVAEVEFTSAGASVQFTAPPWFGTEVIEDEAYKNLHLALHGKPSRVSPPRGTNAHRSRG